MDSDSMRSVRLAITGWLLAVVCALGLAALARWLTGYPTGAFWQWIVIAASGATSYLLVVLVCGALRRHTGRDRTEVDRNA